LPPGRPSAPAGRRPTDRVAPSIRIASTPTARTESAAPRPAPARVRAAASPVCSDVARRSPPERPTPTAFARTRRRQSAPPTANVTAPARVRSTPLEPPAPPRPVATPHTRAPRLAPRLASASRRPRRRAARSNATGPSATTHVRLTRSASCRTPAG
jgi:hypothetical protein